MNPTTTFLKSVSTFFLDTLFPISCISCNKPGEWLCSDCLEKIPILLDQACPLCEKVPTPNGYACFHCAKKYSIDGLLVSSSYQKSLVSHSIHLYKYRFVEDLCGPLGEIMIKAILSSELLLPEIIVPVPLHPRKLRARGFNQSELLARYISERISPGFPVTVVGSLLTRKKYTQSQMKIKNYAQRRSNIKGAFQIDRKSIRIIKGKRILLVDDVATTGATLFECAETLKRKGAKEVYAIVIARQSLKSK